jgi:glutaredoxin
MSLILYTLPECPNCETLKEKLKIMGYEYEEKDMSTAENIAELRYSGCFALSAPVLQMDDTFYEWHECNKESFFSSLMHVCGEKTEVPDIKETHGTLEKSST